MRGSTPAILQPAEPFLDLSGEDIRKRMFLTDRSAGARTVPAARPHHPGLARLSRLVRAPARPQGFCYLGPVFRHRDDGPGEFLQAGIESFGRPDTAAADAEMLALGLEATAHYGLRRARHPHRRRRTVRRADRRARSRAGVEAAADQGLQPQVLAGARSRPAQPSAPRTRGRNIRACSPRSPAPTPRPRTRWSPTCFRSPASPRSAAARSARSPTVSSNRRRSARRPRCRAKPAR